jgi:hypothetical protein
MDTITTPAQAGPWRGRFANICLAIEGRQRAAELIRRRSASPGQPTNVTATLANRAVELLGTG